MSQPVEVRGRRALTPAVVAASVFLTIAALTSLSFVAARGGLELPLASSGSSAVAVAATASSSSSEAAPSATPPAGTPAATPTAAPAATPAGPSPSASSGPTATATPVPSPAGTPDPLLALSGCPEHPGCYEYVVRRGDTFTGVNDRYRLLLWITRALNPEVGTAGVIVVGQTLYLGRDPEARLDPCPDGAACRLYAIRSGDTLSGIADRFRVPEAGILTLNPGLAPNAIATGEVIRLPLFG